MSDQFSFGFMWGTGFAFVLMLSYYLGREHGKESVKKPLPTPPSEKR